MIDRADSLGEKVANMAAIGEARERLETLPDGLSESEVEAATEAGEAAMLIELRDALYGERYTDAAALAEAYGSAIEEPVHRVEFLLMEAFLREYEGRIEEALALVAEARSTGAGDAVELDTIEGMLLDQSAEAVDVAAAARQGDRMPALAQEETPATFALGAAYPNPFNPRTTIPFWVPEAGQVHLEVFDVTGRRVALLADGMYEAGAYAVVFEAGGLPSGLYLVRARFATGAGRVESQTKTLTLMR
jgi:hypothetical protein